MNKMCQDTGEENNRCTGFLEACSDIYLRKISGRYFEDVIQSAARGGRTPPTAFESRLHLTDMELHHSSVANERQRQ